MSLPTRLLLVRHAEPDSSVHGCVYGRLDVGLSPQGVVHADRLAGLLAPIPVAALYTSPLRRAVATAAPIAAALGLKPTVVPDLRELDFGELEGLPLTTVAERFPDIIRWTDAPAGVAFPGGEAVADLRARALRAVRELIDRHEGETVAAVSHAMVIRAVLADALEMPPDALFRLGQDYGGISVVDWFGPLPIVQLVNAVEPPAGRLPSPG